MAQRIGKYKISKRESAISLADGGTADGAIIFSGGYSGKRTVIALDATTYAPTAAQSGAVLVFDGTACTVTLPTCVVGLQYTFNNEYPVASMPLSDNTAIFITTRNPVATLMGDGNQDGEVNILDIVVIVNHIVNLELLDPMGVYMSDMDDNGNINILDIIQIINVLLP